MEITFITFRNDMGCDLIVQIKSLIFQFTSLEKTTVG
jgi:hypothetical protein